MQGDSGHPRQNIALVMGSNPVGASIPPPKSSCQTVGRRFAQSRIPGTAQIAAKISFKGFEGPDKNLRGGIFEPFGACAGSGALRKGQPAIFLRICRPSKSVHSIAAYAPG